MWAKKNCGKMLEFHGTSFDSIREASVKITMQREIFLKKTIALSLIKKYKVEQN